MTDLKKLAEEECYNMADIDFEKRTIEWKSKLLLKLLQTAYNQGRENGIEEIKKEAAKLRLGDPVIDYLFCISESRLDFLKTKPSEEK